jgi:hypothetical protein
LPYTYSIRLVSISLWVLALGPFATDEYMANSKEQGRFSTFIDTSSKLLDLLIKLGAVVAAVIKLAHYL